MTDSTAQRPVPELIASKRDEIAALFRAFGVAKLEVFGSVMTDEFDSTRSDIDFIVQYAPDAYLGAWHGRYQELKARLAELLSRDVDLVTIDSGAMRDPYFRRWADPTRTVVIDALQDGQAPQRHAEAVPLPGRD